MENVFYYNTPCILVRWLQISTLFTQYLVNSLDGTGMDILLGLRESSDSEFLYSPIKTP